MTNYEYYRQTIDKITRMGRMVAVEEKTGVDWSIVPIDTKIYVKDCEKCEWEPRYFAKYENGIVYAWSCGTTSFSRQYEDDYGPWVYARLAEE